MTLVQRAQSAYAKAATPVRSQRSVEYDAFSKISHTLRDAALDRDRNFPAFAAALADNRRLWTTLAVDVAQSENALPEDLRARIFWLAEFAEAETREILRGAGDARVLIEINAAIMQGLRGNEVPA
ncbi:MAG: flagellar biosynthesis regulator FlaF [Boseongicola sp.]